MPPILMFSYREKELILNAALIVYKKTKENLTS
jgi:hypothetical protein